VTSCAAQPQRTVLVSELTFSRSAWGGVTHARQRLLVGRVAFSYSDAAVNGTPVERVGGRRAVEESADSESTPICRQ